MSRRDIVILFLLFFSNRSRNTSLVLDSSSWVLPLLHTYIGSFFLLEVVQICPGIPWIKFKSISIGFCKNSVLETRIEVFSVRMALFFEMIKMEELHQC